MDIMNAEVAAEDVVVITGSLFLIGEARVAYSTVEAVWNTVA